jgi:hypothetical protein
MAAERKGTGREGEKEERIRNQGALLLSSSPCSTLSLRLRSVPRAADQGVDAIAAHVAPLLPVIAAGDDQVEPESVTTRTSPVPDGTIAATASAPHTPAA